MTNLSKKVNKESPLFPALTLKSLNEKIDLVAKAAGNSDMDIRKDLFKELEKLVKESDKHSWANIYERTIKKVDELLTNKVSKLEKELEDLKEVIVSGDVYAKFTNLRLDIRAIEQKFNMFVESVRSYFEKNDKKIEELNQNFDASKSSRESEILNSSNSSFCEELRVRIGDVWLTKGEYHYAYITGESKCPSSPYKFKGIIFEFSHKSLFWSPIKHFKMIKSNAVWDKDGMYNGDIQYENYFLDKLIFRN